jgi:hypothetical protein
MALQGDLGKQKVQWRNIAHNLCAIVATGSWHFMVNDLSRMVGSFAQPFSDCLSSPRVCHCGYRAVALHGERLEPHNWQLCAAAAGLAPQRTGGAVGALL